MEVFDRYLAEEAALRIPDALPADRVRFHIIVRDCALAWGRHPKAGFRVLRGKHMLALQFEGPVEGKPLGLFSFRSAVEFGEYRFLGFRLDKLPPTLSDAARTALGRLRDLSEAALPQSFTFDGAITVAIRKIPSIDFLPIVDEARRVVDDGNQEFQPVDPMKRMMIPAEKASLFAGRTTISPAPRPKAPAPPPPPRAVVVDDEGDDGDESGEESSEESTEGAAAAAPTPSKASSKASPKPPAPAKVKPAPPAAAKAAPKIAAAPAKPVMKTAPPAKSAPPAKAPMPPAATPKAPALLAAATSAANVDQRRTRASLRSAPPKSSPKPAAKVAPKPAPKVVAKKPAPKLPPKPAPKAAPKSHAKPAKPAKRPAAAAAGKARRR